MKPHPFDPVSFIVGAIFALIGAAFLLPVRPFGFIDLIFTSGRWLWPAVLLGIGVLILVSTLRGDGTDEGEPQD